MPRRDTTAFAWRYVREHGVDEPVPAREVASVTFDEFRDVPGFGYSASGNRYDAYTMWDSCVRDRLKQLPGIRGPGERGDGYRYVPPGE